MGKNKDILNANTTAIQRLERDNQRLVEIVARLEAQKARGFVEKTNTEVSREKLKTLRINSFFEDAINIFTLDGIAENDCDFFNSKRLECEIAKHGSVCIFEKNGTFYALPYNGIAGSLNCYNESDIIKPYSASVQGLEFSELTVNKNCVVISDFFTPTETNINNSYTIQEAIRVYSALIADCEIAKIKNRNILKIPFLFEVKDESGGNKNSDKIAMDVKAIVDSVCDNDEAIISSALKYLKVVDFTKNYYGKELDECIANYKKELKEFLGIATNNFEKNERLNIPETEKENDSYNLKIKGRLENRERGLKNLKKIFPQMFGNCKWVVNLEGYNGNNENEKEEKENDAVSNANFKND